MLKKSIILERKNFFEAIRPLSKISTSRVWGLKYWILLQNSIELKREKAFNWKNNYYSISISSDSLKLSKLAFSSSLSSLSVLSTSEVSLRRNHNSLKFRGFEEHAQQQAVLSHFQIMDKKFGFCLKEEIKKRFTL